jgi:hypothetical protein
MEAIALADPQFRRRHVLLADIRFSTGIDEFGHRQIERTLAVRLINNQNCTA